MAELEEEGMWSSVSRKFQNVSKKCVCAKLLTFFLFTSKNKDKKLSIHSATLTSDSLYFYYRYAITTLQRR
jgi:hypothetical protein